MSRTWRNRRSLPKFLKIRDGSQYSAHDSEGNEYFFNSHSYIEITYRRYSGTVWQWGLKPEQTLFQIWQEAYFFNRKAPYQKRYIKKFRRPWYTKERKKWRKFYEAQYRAKVKNKLSQNLWDEFPICQKTSGWHSW